MKRFTLLSPLFLLLCHTSLAQLVRQREDLPTPTTKAAATSTSSDDNNAATIPTPITTALPTDPVPLYIPQVDPSEKAQDIQVQYFGPGNGGSTIYQVVMQGKETAQAVTATLFEDATNAKLLGGQDLITIDGITSIVDAAASCGFQDGLTGSQRGKDAGLCYYWHVIDQMTTTWATSITQISAETSVRATLEPLQSSLPQTGSDIEEWSSSTSKLPIPQLLITATLLILVTLLF